MPYAKSVDGTRIYYQVIGDGEPLIFLSGLGSPAVSWQFQLPLAYNFKLILIDNRGVGNSDKPEQPYTIDIMADYVKTVIDGLNLTKVNLVGTSMGGMIAQ
ncbi:alpha/beta fold hydrolase [Saccharolobus shibatae]|uniref:AB hydrolase-1 domain-containing protein n=1 Tax=Saccharolobus shibatae TaxID=2286 RepID=A0A8F5GZK1_9CREN|nr:alpha/beta hydrolase [Saccharolobus shibatae]QXJ35443.1 hypothetical protein J5U22_01990 [Saccharolobus shibatae]